MKSVTLSLLLGLCSIWSGPSVLATEGDGDWASAYTKAATALAKLTQAQKISMVTGVGWQKGPCVGNVAAIPSIGFPELCLQDGPLGYVLHFSSSFSKQIAKTI
jgi:beta-glucosidase